MISLDPGFSTIKWKVFSSSARVMGCAGLLQRSLCLLILGAVLPAAANPPLRSSFPGRRVGGGTRGECTARLLVHLVPKNSVFAPDQGHLLGIMQGPTQAPKPLLIDFRRLAAAGTPAVIRNRIQRLRFAPSEAGLILFRTSVRDGVLWESSYQCQDPPPGVDMQSWDGGFDAPPAISLLLVEPTTVDRGYQDRLYALVDRCAGDVSKQDLINDFDLEVLDLRSWPDRLPVRCLF
mgnify:CR=1 FL=1